MTINKIGNQGHTLQHSFQKAFSEVSANKNRQYSQFLSVFQRFQLLIATLTITFFINFEVFIKSHGKNAKFKGFILFLKKCLFQIFCCLGYGLS